MTVAGNGKSPIDRLFDKLDMLYPGRWRQQFKSSGDMQNWAQCWAEELSERGITFDEVKNGLARCVDFYDWPPSFPEFLKACRPAIDYEAAFYEAQKQMHLRGDGRDTWSNPAIYWTSVALGSDILSQDYRIVKGRWKTALDQSIDAIKNGKLETIIPKRPKLLTSQQRPAKEYSEAAKLDLAKIGEILNSEPAWKKNLREQGMDRVNTGFKQVAELLPRSVNE